MACAATNILREGKWAPGSTYLPHTPTRGWDSRSAMAGCSRCAGFPTSNRNCQSLASRLMASEMHEYRYTRVRLQQCRLRKQRTTFDSHDPRGVGVSSWSPRVHSCNRGADGKGLQVFCGRDWTTDSRIVVFPDTLYLAVEVDPRGLHLSLVLPALGDTITVTLKTGNALLIPGIHPSPSRLASSLEYNGSELQAQRTSKGERKVGPISHVVC